MNDEPTSIDLEIRKKRLVYRSNYRGFKEADLILGGYAKANIETMTEAEVLMFEDLLGAKDHDIYGWVNQTLRPCPQITIRLYSLACATLSLSNKCRYSFPGISGQMRN